MMRSSAQQTGGPASRKKRTDVQTSAAATTTGAGAARQQQQHIDASPFQQPPAAAVATTAIASILRLLRLTLVVVVLAMLRTQCGLSVVALEGLFPLALLVMVQQSAVGGASERLAGGAPTTASSTSAAAAARAASMYAVYAPALEQLLLCSALYLFVDDVVLEHLSVLLLAINALQWTLGSLAASGAVTLLGFAVVYQLDVADLTAGASAELASLAFRSVSLDSGGGAAAGVGSSSSSNGGSVYVPPRWVAAVCLALSVQFFLNVNQLLAQTRAYVFQGAVDYLCEAFSSPVKPPSSLAARAMRWALHSLDAATFFITPASVLALVLWYALMMIEWHAHVSIGGTLVTLFTVLALKQARTAAAPLIRSVVGAAAAATGADRPKSSHVGFLLFIVVVDAIVYATASAKIVTVLANGTVSALTVMFLWSHSRPSAASRPVLPLAVVWVAMVATDLWMHLRGLVLPDHPMDPYGVHTLPDGGILAGVHGPGALRHCLAVHTSGFGLYLMYCALADSSRAAHVAEEELTILTFLAQPPHAQSSAAPVSDDNAGVRSASQPQLAATTATSSTAETSSNPVMPTAIDGAALGVSGASSSRGVSPDGTQDTGAAVAADSLRPTVSEREEELPQQTHEAEEEPQTTNADEPAASSALPTANDESTTEQLVSHVVGRTMAGKEASGNSSMADSVVSSTANSTASREPTPVASQVPPLSKKERAQKKKDDEERRRATLAAHKEAPPAGNNQPNNNAGASSVVEAQPPAKGSSKKKDDAPIVVSPASEAPPKPSKATAPAKPSSTNAADKKRAPVSPQAVAEASPPPPPPATATANSKHSTSRLAASDQPPPKHQPTTAAPVAASERGAINAPTASAARKTVVLANGKLSFGDVVRGAKQPLTSSNPGGPASQAPFSVDGALPTDGNAVPPAKVKASSASTGQPAGKGPAPACSPSSGAVSSTSAARTSIASVDAVDHHSMVPQPKSVQLREKREAAAAAAARGKSQAAPTSVSGGSALTSPLMKASKAIMSIDGDKDDDVSSTDEEWTTRAAVDSPRQLGSTSNPVAPPSPLSGFARPPPISPQRGNGATNTNARVSASATAASDSRGGDTQQRLLTTSQETSFDAFTGLRLEGTSPRDAGSVTTGNSAGTAGSDLSSRIIAAAQRSAAAAAESIDIAMFHQALTGRAGSGQDDNGHAARDVGEQRVLTQDTMEDEADDGATIDVHAVSKIDSMISQLSGNSPLPSDGMPFGGKSSPYTVEAASSQGTTHNGSGGGRAYAYPSFITLEELTRSVSADAPPQSSTHRGVFTNIGGSSTTMPDDASSASGASSAHGWPPGGSHGTKGGTDSQPAEFDSLLSQGFLHLLDDDNSQPSAAQQQAVPQQQLSLAASSNQEYNRLMQQMHMAATAGGNAGGNGPLQPHHQQLPYYSPPPPPPPAAQTYQLVNNCGTPSTVVGGAVSQVVMTAQGPYAVVLLPSGQQLMCPVVYQQPPQQPGGASNNTPAVSPTKRP